MTIDSNKRTPLNRLTSRNISAILAASGYSFSIIADAEAERTGTAITKQQVAVDIAQVIDAHRPLAPDSPEEIRILQIARLEMISNLALQGFLDSATTDTQTVSTGEKEGKRTSKSRKRSAGDAKFLAIMQSVEVERSKILGSYAPERREEVGELTVTFAWKETPTQPAISASDATDGTFRLAESVDIDAGLQPSQAPPDGEN